MANPVVAEEKTEDAGKAKRLRNLRRGNPGNKGGSGRPSDAFRIWCRAVLERKTTTKAVADVADNPDHPAFLPAVKFLAGYGYGLPEQKVTGDPDQPIEIRVSFRHESSR